MKIGYSRCSAQGQNHSSQIDALKAAGCERIFQETESGAKADRSELRSLMEFARPNDVLCVLRLDRLGRNMRHVLDIVDQLNRKQIALVSLSENIDGTTPSGRLAFHMLAAMSQYELEQKRIACEQGRLAAVARGRCGGRPRSVDETKLKVAKALVAGGELSMAEIAAQIGVAPSTLYRCLPGGRAALAGAPEQERVAA